MKHFYSLLTGLIVMSGLAIASEASAQATVQWDQVVVKRSTVSADVTVTAKITIPQGATFNSPVYPEISSLSFGVSMGKGTSQTITLPTASGSYTSDVLTWTFTAGSVWGRDSSRTMMCTMYYTDSAGDPVKIGSTEVLRDGTTGVDDVLAEANPYTEVYTITGVRVAAGDNVDISVLDPGMYILRTATGATKIVR